MLRVLITFLILIPVVLSGQDYQIEVSNATSSVNPDNFVMLWETEIVNETVTIPVPPGTSGYNFIIDWGDGTTDYLTDADKEYITVSSTETAVGYSHVYTDPDTFQIQIAGIFPHIYFNNSYLRSSSLNTFNRYNILSIEQWGNIKWEEMTNAFDGCVNLQINAVDAPRLNKVDDMSYMFRDCKKLDTDLSYWDTRNVKYMRGVFVGAFIFNNGGQAMDWNTSDVKDMRAMFSGAVSFNNGDTANVASKPLDWNTRDVEDMSGMFFGASSFNQELDWNTRRVRDMSRMFKFATIFNNGETSNSGSAKLDWNTEKVTDLTMMFNAASSFNQELKWRTSDVLKMDGTFAGASLFNNGDTANNGNEPLKWNTKRVTSMNQMFSAATSFNQELDWRTNKVEAMNDMFYQAGAFNNGDSGNNSAMPLEWDTESAKSMNNMFASASSFNQELSWNTSSVSQMDRMFADAVLFDQDLGKWNILNVQSMKFMFDGVMLSTSNYDSLLVGWATQVTNNPGSDFVQYNNSIHAGNSMYCGGDQARQDIFNIMGISIIDAGEDPLCGLPVTWLDFSGSKEESNILLQWSTASENSCSHYSIERAYDNSGFLSIGTINGSGNSNTVENYTFTDLNVPGTTLFYRLKQVDFDGKYEYSKVIKVRYNLQEDNITLYPNPAKDHFTVHFHSEQSVRIYHVSGKLMQELPCSIGKVQIDCSSWPPGVYILQCDSYTTSKRIIIN